MHTSELHFIPFPSHSLWDFEYFCVDVILFVLIYKMYIFCFVPNYLLAYPYLSPLSVHLLRLVQKPTKITRWLANFNGHSLSSSKILVPFCHSMLSHRKPELSSPIRSNIEHFPFTWYTLNRNSFLILIWIQYPTNFFLVMSRASWFTKVIKYTIWQTSSNVQKLIKMQKKYSSWREINFINWNKSQTAAGKRHFCFWNERKMSKKINALWQLYQLKRRQWHTIKIC